jgi:cytochrome c-type biogenesis protein CcmH/NrfF
MFLVIALGVFFTSLVLAAIRDIKRMKQNKECNHFYHIDGDEQIRCLHCGEESNDSSKDYNADKR